MPARYNSSFLKSSPPSHRPMARRMKDSTQWSFFSLVRMVLLFVRSRWPLFAGFSFVVVIIFLVFFTPLLTFRDYFISLDERAGCLSPAYVREYFSLHVRFIWDVFLFSDADLLAMHSCARKFILTWSPFQYRSLHVRVVTYTPVFKVRVEHLSANSSFLDTLRFFQAPISHDDYRFLLANGHFVVLDAEPVVPEIVLRFSSHASIDTFRFPRSYIYSLLQLHVYFKEHFGDSVQFVVSDIGYVDVRIDTIPHIYLSLKVSLVEQLSSLRAFLGATTINTSKLESVDVRFGYVVVRERL